MKFSNPFKPSLSTRVYREFNRSPIGTAAGILTLATAALAVAEVAVAGATVLVARVRAPKADNSVRPSRYEREAA